MSEDQLSEAAATGAAAAVDAVAAESDRADQIADAAATASDAQMAASDAQSVAEASADVAATAVVTSAGASAEADTARQEAATAREDAQEVAYATEAGLAALQARVDDLHAWRESQTQPPKPPEDEVKTIPVSSSSTPGSETKVVNSDNRSTGRRHRFGR